MNRYFSFLFISFSMLCCNVPLFSDGLIITFEEIDNDSTNLCLTGPEENEKEELAIYNKVFFEKEKSEVVNDLAQVEPSSLPPIEEKSKPLPEKKEPEVEQKPKILEKKDFLQDHEEVPTPDAEAYEKTFMRTILVLIGLLILVLLTAWLIKKFSRGKLRHFNHGKAIKILERRPLSHKSVLYLIEVRGKQVLIAESQLEVTPLSSLDWEDLDKEMN